MKIDSVPMLADAIKHYYAERDLLELCIAFDVKLDFDSNTGKPAYMALAKKLVVDTDIGNHRRFLHALVPSLVNRAKEGVATTDWERRSFHESMVDRLRPIENALSEAGIPEEISISENRPFLAKSETREFLAKAETDVTVVDNYVGAGTLDCLRDIERPIRLLTGTHGQAVEDGFDRSLAAFRTEGHTIEVRQHPRLHDRYILFNERCWLVGSSLKDAGRKKLNIIECVDSKTTIREEIVKKWQDSMEYRA